MDQLAEVQRVVLATAQTLPGALDGTDNLEFLISRQDNGGKHKPVAASKALRPEGKSFVTGLIDIGDGCELGVPFHPLSFGVKG